MTGATATLAFWVGPDFEKPWDTNKDNVYEVTLVVTDSVGETGEYDVTVKVINSTDDNKPGKVTILNRQPEVATALTASSTTRTVASRELKWQWYRSSMLPCHAETEHNSQMCLAIMIPTPPPTSRRRRRQVFH